MRTTLCFTLTLLAFAALPFVRNSIAQDNSPEFVVRAIYFYPNDLQPHPDIDTVLDYFMKDFQKHFADRMEFHGFGRKTFVFEADENGNTIVHQVKGNFNDAYYSGNTYSKVLGEFTSRFGNSKNINFFVVDTRNQLGTLPSGELGHACGIGWGGSNNGFAVVPAQGNCFGGQIPDAEPDIYDYIRGFGVHELLHAFGMLHDDSGGNTLDLTSCAAEWLDGHSYFNHGKEIVDNGNTSIQMDPPTLVSPPATIGLRFEITDPDGLHQAQLIKSGDRIIACQKLSGTSAIVEFTTTDLIGVSTINLQVMDAYGNFTFGGQPFHIDLTNLLPEPEAISIPDPNLRAAIVTALGKPPSASIDWKDMATLTYLEAIDANVSDLTGLNFAINLRRLYLGGNNISDISALAGLIKLQELSLHLIDGSDISVLADLTELTGLYIVSSNISDISALEGLTKLRSLNLGDNSVSDLSPVAGLTDLTWVVLAANNITDLSPLVENTGLGIGDEVNLNGNPLSYPSIYTHIPVLQERGVEVFFDNRTPQWVRIVSGNDQQGLPGAALEKPLVVEVQDERGDAFEGVPVTFTITAGGGTLSKQTTTTDSNGRAESILTLGPNPGTNTVEATVTGIEEKRAFNAEGSRIPKELEIISGIDQAGLPGDALEKAFVVEVRDQSDKPFPGVEVTFSVSSGDGTLSATGATTDSNGRAESTLTLGPNPGTNTVTVSVTGSQETRTFTAEGIRMPKTLEIISGADQEGLPGEVLEKPFVVEVRHQSDKPLPDVTVTFTVTAGGGTLSATSVTTDSNGRVASTLTLGPNLGKNSVHVSVEGISQPESFTAVGIRPEFDLFLPAGISLIHIPLRVTAVDEAPLTIESMSDLYDALGGAEKVNFLVTRDAALQRWRVYFGSQNRGTSGDQALTDDLGIIAAMKDAVTIRLGGDSLGRDGNSAITLHRGTNLVGVPLRDSRIMRVSDLLSLEGIRGNVPSIFVSAQGKFVEVRRAADVGNIPITGGQSFVLEAREAATVAISGNAWYNTSGTTAAPPVAVTGIEVGDVTPVLALRGSIVDEVRVWSGRGRDAVPTESGIRVTVKNLSTSKAVTAVTGDEHLSLPDKVKLIGVGYQFAVVDMESGRAARVGDVLEVSAKTSNPLIRVRSLRYTVTAADVRASRIQLPELVAYEIPAETALLPNYPNPFNPETWIPYRLAEDADVTLSIYDSKGVTVRRLDLGHQLAGYYADRGKAAYWDGRNNQGESVASGLYFYQLATPSFRQLRRMVIVK